MLRHNRMVCVRMLILLSFFKNVIALLVDLLIVNHTNERNCKMKTTKMQTCNTCRYWRRKAKDYRGQILGECYSPNQTDDNIGSSNDKIFGVFDGEPYNEGTFRCGPKFGCIHHKFKGNAN